MSAFEQIKALFPGRWISHIICAWHKANRIRMKIDKSSLCTDDKEKLKSMLHIICYSRCAQHAQRTVVEFTELARRDPELSKYLTDHVICLLDKFAVSWLPDCFNLGYNTSSAAESNNARSKRGLTARQYTMSELSENVRMAEESSDREQQYRDRLRQQGSLALKFGVDCRERIEKKIEGSLQKAFRLTARCQGGRYMFSDPLHEGEEICATGTTCECRKLEMTGLPCSHLLWVQMRKYQQGESDVIFKEEWRMERLNYRLVAPKVTPGEIGALLHPPLIAAGQGEQAAAVEEGESRANRATGQNPAQRRYKKLSQLANPLIARASMYEEMTEAVMQTLTELTERVIRETAEMPVASVGRPRIRRFRGSGAV